MHFIPIFALNDTGYGSRSINELCRIVCDYDVGRVTDLNQYVSKFVT